MKHEWTFATGHLVLTAESPADEQLLGVLAMQLGLGSNGRRQHLVIPSHLYNQPASVMPKSVVDQLAYENTLKMTKAFADKWLNGNKIDNTPGPAPGLATNLIDAMVKDKAKENARLQENFLRELGARPGQDWMIYAIQGEPPLTDGGRFIVRDPDGHYHQLRIEL